MAGVKNWDISQYRALSDEALVQFLYFASRETDNPDVMREAAKVRQVLTEREAKDN